jgi:DHA1 family tetracycline resistance protein-like MFS transporter
MAVMAPVLGGGMLTLVSTLPQGHWLIGLPYYFCGALQLLAMGLALRHFARERTRSVALAGSEAAAAP